MGVNMADAILITIFSVSTILTVLAIIAMWQF
jgi:hypothetical protein